MGTANVQFSVYLTPVLDQRVRRRVAELGQTNSEFARRVFQDYFDRLDRLDAEMQSDEREVK